MQAKKPLSTHHCIKGSGDRVFYNSNFNDKHLFSKLEISKLFSLRVVKSKSYSDVVKCNVKSNQNIQSRVCSVKKSGHLGVKTAFLRKQKPITGNRMPKVYKCHKKKNSPKIVNASTPVFNRFASLGDNASVVLCNENLNSSRADFETVAISKK